MTVKEATAHWGVHRSTVYRWLKMGILSAQKEKSDTTHRVQWQIKTVTRPTFQRKQQYPKEQRTAIKKVLSPLPELQGSEKQVAWAKKLRAEYFATPYTAIKHGGDLSGLRDWVQLHDETRASYWIERRSGGSGSFRYAGKHPGGR